MSSHTGEGFEIERVWLLKSVPRLADLHPKVLEIEQGYLPNNASSGAEGRVRRMRLPCGETRFYHTIKRGLGLVREETERQLSCAEFDALWEETAPRRLRKRRSQVQVGDLVWEIDEFLDYQLVLAEVELPKETYNVQVPAWLEPYIEREVTEEPAFRNYHLACGALPGA